MAKQINIETFKGDFSEAPLSYDEFSFIKQDKISHYIILDWRVKLKRELTYRELLILEACEKNAILLNEDDFKPFPG